MARLDTSKNHYSVWANNDEGASTDIGNGTSKTKLIEQARNELGSGWTVHIDQLHLDNAGNVIGKEQIEQFRTR